MVNVTASDTPVVDAFFWPVLGDIDSKEAPANPSEVSEKEEKGKEDRFLSINANLQLTDYQFADPDPKYASWLRVLLLRMIMMEGRLRTDTRLCHKFEQHARGIWGFENFDYYLEVYGGVRTSWALKDILRIWESDFLGEMVLPKNMADNLRSLQGLLNLNATETAIVAFATILHSEPLFPEFIHTFEEPYNAQLAPRAIARILQLDFPEVERALSRDGVLVRSQLVTLDENVLGNLVGCIDLISESFAKRMFMQHENALSVMGDMIKPAQAPNLTEHNFKHVEERLGTFLGYLQNAQCSSASGANVLIYGAPGTGKTEFARLLAKKLGCTMLEVGVSNQGYPISPSTRFRYFKLAQGFLSRTQSLVLFDECEEVLSGEVVRAYAPSIEPMGQKSWLNNMLETNLMPTIWVANSIENIDPAIIRRFDLVLDMPLPTQGQRKAMLLSESAGLVSDRLAQKLSLSNGCTPAMVSQISRVLKVVAHEKSANSVETIACTLVNDRLAAQGLGRLHATQTDHESLDFEPEFINTSLSLTELQANLSQLSQARICVYGPPGTGKTAFGKWLGRGLDRPIHLHKASDLLGQYVGQTERKIANAFEQAHHEQAILQIDEVDSFLQKRARARHSWEITLVNEMLTQIESFNGIFIASTNRFEQLDTAVQRRFDLNLKFNYLTPSATWTLFKRCCEKIGLSQGDELGPDALKSLVQLTPGDFEQAIRHSAFKKPQRAADLLEQLRTATALKPREAPRPIGFL